MVHELEASGNTEEYKNIITEHIFKNHLYNEIVLAYMVHNFNGTSSDMYAVWKAAKSFSVKTDELSERIISQMMFTGAYSGRLAEVFGRLL